MTDSLWEFASTRYAQDGAAAACLALQDELDADVNLLLTAAWLAHRGLRWDLLQIEQIAAACAQWRALCLLPLRAIRRDLKNLAGAENWYQRLKALELEAERQQLHRIEATVAALFGESVADAAIESGSAEQALIEANLIAYLSTLPGATAARAHTDAARLAQRLTATATA